MSAHPIDTWEEFGGFGPAEIRRRQMRGQEVAELDVSSLRSFRDDEPLSVPMRRIAPWTWAAIGSAVVAVVATFALARSPKEAVRAEAPPQIAPVRSAIVVPAPEPVVAPAPAAVTPPKPSKARARR